MSDFQDKLKSELDQVGKKPVKPVKKVPQSKPNAGLAIFSGIMALLIVGMFVFNKNLEKRLIEKRSQESFSQYDRYQNNGPSEPIKSIPKGEADLWDKVEENSRKITLLGYANNQNFSVYRQDHPRNNNSDLMFITRKWRATTMPTLLHLSEEDRDFISENVR